MSWWARQGGHRAGAEGRAWGPAGPRAVLQNCVLKPADQPGAVHPLLHPPSPPPPAAPDIPFLPVPGHLGLGAPCMPSCQRGCPEGWCRELRFLTGLRLGDARRAWRVPLPVNYLFIVKHRGPHVWAPEAQGCARQAALPPSPPLELTSQCGRRGPERNRGGEEAVTIAVGRRVARERAVGTPSARSV